MLAALPAAQLRALFPSRRAFVQRHGVGPVSVTALRRELAARARGRLREGGRLGHARVRVRRRRGARPRGPPGRLGRAHVPGGARWTRDAGRARARAARVARAAAAQVAAAASAGRPPPLRRVAPQARRRGARRTRPTPESARSNGDQREPSGSSFSSRSKEPRRPPRLSIMCTSVASRVHGHHGRAVLELPWWDEDDVQHRGGELLGEAREVLDQRGGSGSSRAGSRPGACRGRSCRSPAGRPCRPRACRCRAAARRSRRRRGRSPGRSPRSPTRPGRPSASARAARAGRPGGSAWPPGRRGTAARSASSGPNTASSSARRCGFWTVASELAQVGLHAGRRARRAVQQLGEVVLVLARRRAPSGPRARRPRSARSRARRDAGLAAAAASGADAGAHAAGAVAELRRSRRRRATGRAPAGPGRSPALPRAPAPACPER